MKCRLLLHMDINVQDEREAIIKAKKLEELLKNPVVRMSLEGEGIRPIGDAVVYQPTKVP